MTVAQRWQQWFEAGWVHDARAPELATQPAPHPWYIRLILGVCGWVGGLLLMVFIGFSWFGLMRENAMGLAGLILLAIAYVIYRMAKSELGGQFALALSLAGQGAVAVALFSSDAWDMVAALFAIGGLQLVLLWAMPNALHRTLSMFFAVIALHLAFVLRGYPSPLPAVAAWLTAVLWLDESRWQFRLGERFLPIAVGATLAALLVMAPFDVGQLGLHYDTSAGDWPSSLRWIFRAGGIAASLVWIWAGWRWAGRAPWRLRLPAMSLAVLMAVAAWWMPGLSLGLLVLLLGFARGRPALMGLGVAAGLLHLSWFYYSLAATLLVKSVSLVVLGGVLLLACRALPHVWKEARDV